MGRRLDDGRKVYQFALYGGQASGKTCILIALGMPRRANPQGYSCTWIQDSTGPPTTSRQCGRVGNQESLSSRCPLASPGAGANRERQRPTSEPSARPAPAHLQFLRAGSWSVSCRARRLLG